MRICIDTNIYSLFKRGKADIKELLENADEIFIPVIVLGELFAGFYSGKYTSQNIKELEDFLNKPGIMIVEISKNIADRYGELIKNTQEKRLDLDNLNWFTGFFKYGVPPMGGFCLGIERFTMKLLNLKNIRETALFPRDPKRLLP